MADNNKTNSGYENMLGIKTAVKDAEGKPQPIVIQKITVRPPVIRKLDIEIVRNAQKAAKATVPRWTELYDMYEDILLDPHLRSVVDKRIMAVTNIDWEFVDENDKPVELINDWIDTPDFELTVSEILKSKLWGYTMIEFDFYTPGYFGAYLVPRKHMRPQQGLITYEQTGNTGLNVREGAYADTILEAGDPKDLGLLLAAAFFVVYKRGNFGDWAQFIERFGQPIIDAIWDGYDESQRVMLLEAIDGMGGGGTIVRPAGTQMELLPGGTNNPTGQLNDSFNNACNDELSKVILGQTETTESSSSSGYAQSATHSDTESDINVSDRNFVRRILNRRLVKIFEANGIKTYNGRFQVKTNKDDIAAKKGQLEIDVRLVNELGVPLSDEYFYETYGRPKPDNYEQLKEALKEKSNNSQFGAGGFGLSLPDLLKLRDNGFFD